MGGGFETIGGGNATRTLASSSVHRRRVVRYRIRVPAVFRWVNSDGISHKFEGLTHDISTQGVFVNCSDLPPVGTTGVVEVSFPPFDPAVQSGLRLKAEIRVTRIQSGAGESGRGFGAFADSD